ncbi:hypothetical protein KJ713_01550, partial [Patescibacteria group bacterium]|nr:hypothetical protein [Patescibacteria group bacterium]
MGQRKKVVVYLIAATVIVLAVIAGIGIKKGWFAGLADVISQSYVDVEVKVEKAYTNEQGQIVNRIPFSGATVWAANLPYLKEDRACKEGGSRVPSAAFNGSADSKKGVTNSEGVAKIRLYPTQMTTYYARVERLSPSPRLESCAFHMDMGSWTRGDPDDVFGPQVWKIEGVAAGQSLMKATFLYSETTSGGTEPPPPAAEETATITGYVYVKDTNTNKLIGVPGIRAKTERDKSGTTDGDGKYTISGLKIRSAQEGGYRIDFEYNWECNFERPGSIVVLVDKREATAPPIELTRGGIPADRGKIEGYVYAKEGNILGDPIDGAEVRLMSLASSYVMPVVHTDAVGYYSFCPLNLISSLEYKLSASA